MCPSPSPLHDLGLLTARVCQAEAPGTLGLSSGDHRSQRTDVLLKALGLCGGDPGNPRVVGRRPEES